ncbi:hypothetical protein [Nocardia asteroides]|uniref:hypothetical protein n=1 Tax=Nocardia asteroides TaxID=1824 RepID=UPI001E497820|nr:hypothetical protein [Nocardia asteroides]UGT55190.1 hypothetical protein LTT85_32195 [Nocardia asteroides]
MVGKALVFLVGAGLVVFALAHAVDPFHQTREYRHQVACAKNAGGCFAEETVTIVEKATSTRTSTHIDFDGTISTTTTNHRTIRWMRDGTQHSHDVNGELFAKAREGGQATLRTWQGQIVGIVIDGQSDSYDPRQTGRLGWWLWLAFVGMGLALVGLFEPAGLFMGAFRLGAWAFAGALPLGVVVPTLLANGLEPNFGFFVLVGAAVLFTGVGLTMLVTSFRD